MNNAANKCCAVAILQFI